MPDNPLCDLQWLLWMMGKRVRSQHPEQTSAATGAAGVQVGPRAKALAADLKHRLGVSYGKVSEVLNDTFGLQVSRSGCSQADQKLAHTAQPVYAWLLEAIRQCSVVNADKTGSVRYAGRLAVGLRASRSDRVCHPR